MLRPDIAEGKIAHFCGKHVGTPIGGMRELLTPSTPLGHPQFPSDTAAVGTPKQTLVRTSVSSKDLGEALRQLVIDLSEEVTGDIVLMEHLLADLNQVVGRVRALKAEMKSGTLHPLVASPVLRTVNDGKGFSLLVLLSGFG